MSISSVIITLNEEAVVGRAIESVLSFSSEIIIVDSGSTDRTSTIVKSYSEVKFFSNQFIDYASQRNFGIDRAQSEWIFIIDSDEYIDEESRVWMEKIDNSDCDSFKFRRYNYLWGKPLKYSASPDYTIRLFKNLKNIRYTGQVHETLTNIKKTKKALGQIIHKPNIVAAPFFSKQIKYATLYTKDRNLNILWATTKPFFRFFQIYFLKLWLLDGFRGLVWSMAAACSDAIIAFMVVEKKFNGQDCN